MASMINWNEVHIATVASIMPYAVWLLINFFNPRWENVCSYVHAAMAKYSKKLIVIIITNHL